MKLTFLLLTVALCQVHASGWAQTVTFSGRNVPLTGVFAAIEKQTGYYVFSSREIIQESRPVSLTVSNMPLTDFLNLALKDLPLQYRIVDRSIIISRKPAMNGPSKEDQPPITITGRVTDDKGAALSGANVKVKGKNNGTTTDEEGRFSLSNVPGDAQLEISFVGYETHILPVNNKTEINISLSKKNNLLEETVIIAYGTQKKSDVTGSLSSIKSGALKNVPVVSIEELFKGQAAGVQASVVSGTPGSASNVNIRGISSIGASTQPLYVIDGLPITGQSTETGFAEARTGMDFLNPEDIESIEILKDASATAIYGARGANGVILITTKSGKQGANTTTVSTSAGLTTMANKIKMMTTRQAQEYWELAKARAGRIEPPLNPASLDINTDWQEVTSQDALRQNYNISFQGGQQKLQYYLSLDYLDQEGLLKYTNYNKYSLRATLGSQVSKQLHIDNRFTITRSANDGAFTGGQGGTANATGATQRILQAPTFRVPNDLRGGVDPETGQIYIDPLVVLRDLSDDIKTTNVTEQLTLKYNLLKGLEFQSMAGLTYRFFNNDQYQGAEYAATKSDTRITAQVSNASTTNYINENTLTWRKNTALHSITLLLGNTIQQETSNGNTINAIDFPNTNTGTNALQNAKEVTVSSFKQQWQLASFFGRVNYSYDSKYLLTATLRRDGSSKLAAGNKWGTFPSVALGWRISEESFFKHIRSISSLKIRASWGQIGNSEIGVYQTLSSISAGTNGFDNQLLPYYVLGRYGDPSLKWEISQQANLGIDMELLNGRIAVTADVFDKRTRDLLLSQPVSLSAGYGSYLTNVGSMTNKGVELTVNYQVMQQKNFQWTANFNFTWLKNTVTSLGDVGVIGVGVTVDAKNPRYLAEGKSIGTYYLVKTAGAWQLGEEAEAAAYGAVPGDWKFVDQNKDHIINNDDRVFMGDALPRYSVGFSNSFRYKNFDCMILLSGDFGAQTLNAVKPNLWLARQNGGAAYNLKAWSPTNPTNKLAAPNIFYNSEFLHNGYLEDAGMVRIQNVRLGYRISLKQKSNTSIYMYFSGNNVWGFTKYEGYDPEVGNGISRGIDRFNYPRGRIYNIGAQLTF